MYDIKHIDVETERGKKILWGIGKTMLLPQHRNKTPNEVYSLFTEDHLIANGIRYNHLYLEAFEIVN